MSRYIAVALLLVGLVLVAIGVTQNLTQSGPAQPSVSADVLPQIQIAARFANLAPSGQTTGFAVDPADGSLAVVDRGRQRVERLDASGRPLSEWGPRFESEADAQDLVGIATSGSAWYVLDRGRSLILELDATGRETGSIDLSKLATYGPNGLAVDSHGSIYLADTGTNRILVFSSDGALINTIGSAGSGLGQLKQPMGIAFGPDGSMFVTDFENSRVERWDASVQPTTAWPLKVHAWGIAVDRLGRVFVPDGDEHLVHMFGPRGELLADIGGARDPLDLEAPSQVGIAPDGQSLWVLGTNGLAHVDLSVFSAVAPSTARSTSPFPFVIVGLLTMVLALPPYAVSRRRPNGLQRVEPAPEPPPTEKVLTRKDRRLLVIGLTLFVVGLAMVLLAQALSTAATAKDNAWPLLALLVLGGAIWAAGGAVSSRALPFGWVAAWCAEKSGGPHPFTRRHAFVVGLVCVFGVIATEQWWTGRFETANATRALIVWLTSVALAVVVSTDLHGRRSQPGFVTALVMLGLSAVAILPRIWQVADLPYGIWYDEAQGAFEIRRVFEQGTYTPILNTYGRDTSGFFYIMSGLSLVLGDANILAMRLAAVLVGTLTVAVVYLLGRELFGWRVGVAAALVLAFLRWHINFSRLGFNPISLPLCAALAFWLLARAIRLKRWSDFAWAGLALGLGMHAYTGYRGIPVVAVVALACAAVLQRWPIRSVAPRLVVYLLAGGLTALPVLLFALQDPTAFNARTVQTLILAQPVSDAEKLRQIWDNIQRHAMMFTISGDMNGRHNLPGVPMLDWLTGALVALGLGWILIRPMDWRTLLLLGWAAVSLAGGILTLAFEAPTAVRTIGITPVLAVLAGLGLIACADRVWITARSFNILQTRVASIAAGSMCLAVIAWIGFTNIYTYFGRQMPDPDVFAAFSTRETVPAKTASANRGQYESIVASQTMAPSIQAQFLVPKLQNTIRQFDPAGDLPFRGSGRGFIFLETEHDQAFADVVARMYPDATRSEVRAPGGGNPIVDSFQLDPNVIAAHRGLVRTNTTTNPTWQGGLALDITGQYSFRVPAGSELSIDDEQLGAAATGGVRLQLARGNHTIRLSAPATQAAGPPLDWERPGVAGWQMVPNDALFVAPDGGVGLQASLYAAAQPTGQPPRDEFVDPVIAHYFHTTPFFRFNLDPSQWSLEWTGELDAPSSGAYLFTLDHSQAAELWIDDQPIVGNLTDNRDVRSGSATLAAGRHAVRAIYRKVTEDSPSIYLYWTPPGGAAGFVPASVLYPPRPVVVGPAS